MFVDVVTLSLQHWCVNKNINLFSSFLQTSSKQIVCVFLTTYIGVWSSCTCMSTCTSIYMNVAESWIACIRIKRMLNTCQAGIWLEDIDFLNISASLIIRTTTKGFYEHSNNRLRGVCKQHWRKRFLHCSSNHGRLQAKEIGRCTKSILNHQKQTSKQNTCISES